MRKQNESLADQSLIQSQTLGKVYRTVMNEDVSEERLGLSDVEGEQSEMLDLDDKSVIGDGEFQNFPLLLTRLFRKETYDLGIHHKLFVLSVHAVMLDSGFVGFNLSSGKKIDGFQLPEGLDLCSSTICLWYTFPKILATSKSNAIEPIALKLHSFGKHVNIFGSLVQNRTLLYWVCMDNERFIPHLYRLWMKRHKMADKVRASNIRSRKAFEIWKMLKDGLALPLLTELCEKTGLVPPTNFMCLPIELKLLILQLLPAADLAKIGIVCHELRRLSLDDELWKQKFTKEFGEAATAAGGSNWKQRFKCHKGALRRDRHPLASAMGEDRDHHPAYGCCPPLARPWHFIPHSPSQASPRVQTNRNISPPRVVGFNLQK
ncbi:F-box domain [Dillenia turbinata]|uniref:F-box domain n=1 Tax=Dillenia turbinata TaxID=194707 RepID=A0AAN8WH79_9MAGN